MTKPTTRIFAAAAAIAALALAACAPTPAPGPTTTSATGATTTASPTAAAWEPGKPTPAPSSDEDAQRAAFATIKAYWALEDQIIIKDLGAGAERIDALGTGQATESTREYAAATAASGTRGEGNTIVEPYGGYTSDLKVGDTTIPNGFADLRVCNDVSGVKWTRTDGTSVPAPQQTRTVVPVQVTYEPTTQRWLVTKIDDSTGGTAIAC